MKQIIKREQISPEWERIHWDTGEIEYRRLETDERDGDIDEETDE